MQHRATGHRIVLVAIALVIALSNASAQSQGAADELKVALSDLQSTLRTSETDLGPARPRLEKAVKWLVNNYPRTNPADISAEYARAIRTAAALLAARPYPQAVEDVASELEAKVEHCLKMGVGMGGSVLLKVDTRRGAASVANWQVLYLLKIYERVSGAAPGNFPRLSTPTERPLEPGRYWIWARDPATGRMSDRSLVTVVGQKEILVDLAVP